MVEFLEGPYNKWPRKDEDYNVFVEAIEYFTNKYDVNVILMSHSNGFQYLQRNLSYSMEETIP